jgi:copper transport protein
VQAEPLIHWADPVKEYIGFVAQFLALGAVGFRYVVVRDQLARLRGSGIDAYDAEQAVYRDATHRAAVVGLVAALVQLAQFALGLPEAASRAHLAASQLLASNAQVGAQALLLVAACIGFAMAAARVKAGWPLALVGVLAAPLTGIFSQSIWRLVNPVHRLAAGLWLGTLFVLVVAGLSALLRNEPARERRGIIAADMVNRFSPLALTCGMVVVISGLVTAWRHLNPLSSLWTTPYGYAFLAKLCFVAVVFALGAWNWRRLRPTLGTAEAANAIRRSAERELGVAAVVLAITAVLISLPSPKPPTPPAPGAAQGAPVPAGG